MAETIDYLKLAQDAYTSSTSYFDASIRSSVEADLRQFQGLHPRGSKYLADANKSRSRLFRPKTRSTIRKNEAVAAEAFFSTVDVVSVTAEDDNDPTRQASAEIMMELLQHRLTKSIPWFQILIGGYQDALTVGVVCSYQCWEYNPKKKIDRPMIKLLPIENVRFDPGASWLDPVNTSPYLIELIPMYVKDVKARMNEGDPKTGEKKWKAVDQAKIMSAAKAYSDTTRLQREQGRTDSKDQASNITDFSIVWVHKVIMEIAGVDMVYYTLGTEALLSDPVELSERYRHGVRPYTLGCCVIETHKNYPSSIARLSRDVQAEINDIANLRIDNVRFALNKRYFAKRNKQVDIRSLVRGVAGAVTLMDDPEKDVKVVEFNDVTGSSYQEQDRLNLDFDDVTGSFSGSSVQSNRKLNETVGGMQLLDGSANQVSGYQLRTFVETWVEPTLRQLVKLEQAYETDETILALAGQKAKLLQKFGIDTIDDELLEQELTLTVNVGMGATNPTERVNKFLKAMQALGVILQDNVLVQQGLNVKEVTKEVFGNLGYRDGARFFNTEQAANPEVEALKQMVQELQAKLSQKEDPALTQAKIDHLHAQIEDLGKKGKQLDADTVAKLVAAMFSAMQAAEVVTAVPHVAPVADAIMEAAGSTELNLPTPAGPEGLTVNPVKSPKTGIQFTPGGAVAGDTSPNTPASPAPALPPTGAAPGVTQPETAGTGQAKGIETMRADSVNGMADGGEVDPLTQDPLDAEDARRKAEEEKRTNALNKRLWPTDSGSMDNTLERFGANGSILSGFADGGPIVGPGTGTSDSIPATVEGKPAALSNGEFKIPKAVVDKVGIDFLESLVKEFHVPVDSEPAPQGGAPVPLQSGDFIVPADVVQALGIDFFEAMITQYQ